MTVQEKVEFFVHCQKVLVAHHPDSPFVCRHNNVKERLQQIKAWVERYKGICYADDNTGILYNKLVVSDPNEPIAAVKHSMYQPPDPNFNAVIIDFAAFRDIKDCFPFVRENYQNKIQHVLFARHGKIKIYPVLDIVKQIFNMPTV
jgi:hypothetical protein